MKQANHPIRPLALVSLLTVLVPGIASAAVTYVDLSPDVAIARSGNGVYLDLNGDAPLGPVVYDTVANMLTPDYTALGGTDPANAGFELVSVLYDDTDFGGPPSADEYADFAVVNGITLSDGMGFAARLSAGAPIVPSNPNWAGNGPPLETSNAGSWQATSGIAYVGIAFDPTLQFNGDYYYGWVRIDYNDAANTLKILDYAYETTINTGLTAGAGVPEPASLGLLAIGAGWTLRRRNRTA